LAEKQSLADKIEAWVQSAPTGFKELEDPTSRFELTLWSVFEAISSLVDGHVAEVVELSSGAGTESAA
jgi:hypothetical protein